MGDDDEAARKARAASLRERIASLKPGQTNPEASKSDSESESAGPDESVDEEAPSGESPREFVHRRMRELDNKT